MFNFKTIHVTDTHFGLETHGVDNPDTGLNTRTEDAFQAFDQMINYAQLNNVNLVIHSGDVFNTKTVNQTVVNAFYSRLKALADAGIDVFILQGNHDASKYLQRKNGLDIANTLDLNRIHVTRGGGILDLGYVQIVTVSYWKTPEEIAQEISDHAQNVDWKRPAILVAHLQVEYADFPGSFKHDLPFVPLAALTSHPWTYVALGHIHKPQTLNENPPVLYGGSLVRCSASEEKDKKGFWTFDVIGTKCENLQQVEVSCLRFVTFRGTISQLKTLMEGKQPDLRSCIVRLVIDETDEPIDEAFIKEKFGSAFKCIISKESKEKISTKIAASAGLSLQAYVNNYFEQDADKDELIALVEELRSLEEAKAQA